MSSLRCSHAAIQLWWIFSAASFELPYGVSGTGSESSFFTSSEGPYGEMLLVNTIRLQCTAAAHAPTHKRDVLGTWFLSILAGHHRYAHITGLRGQCGRGRTHSNRPRRQSRPCA